MTNPMPVDTTYGTVSFAAYQSAADSAVDVDALPQARPVTGTVRILRSVPITLFQTAPRPFTLFAGSHVYQVVDGIMVDEEGRDSVTLVATTSPGGNPPGGAGVYYTATFDLVGVAQRSPVIFTLDAAQHVDLSQAAEVPSAPPPAGITRGRSVLAFDNPAGTTNLRISYDDGTTDTIPMPPGTGVAVVADGDRGDVVVTSSGTVWTIDPAVITPAARLLLAGTTNAAIRGLLGTIADTDPRLTDNRIPTAHEHITGDVTGLTAALDAKAPLASPTFTGTPEAPTVKLTAGVPAVGKVWTGTDTAGNASWQTPSPGGGGGGSLTDGDYGDVIVSGTGSVLALDPDVVTTAARTVLDDLTTAAMLTTLGAVATADTRLTDARTPTAHTHGESDVTNLTDDLDSKANAVATSNSIAAIEATNTSQDSAIAAKADAAANTTAHNTLQTNIDTANASIAGKAPLASPTFTGTQTLPAPRITGGTPATGKVWTGVGAAGDGAWTAPAAALPPPDGDKGDITVTSSGTVWTIDAGVITNAKLADVPSFTMRGRVTAAAGPIEDLTPAQGRTVLSVYSTAAADAALALKADASTTTAALALRALAARLLTAGTGLTGGGDLTADRTFAVAYGTTGTTAAAGNDARLTDQRTPTDNSATNAKLADVPTATIKGRLTAATGDPEDLTPAQAKTVLALVKADVGLGSVDNTTDAAKPISTATQTALNGKLSTAAGAVGNASLTPGAGSTLKGIDVGGSAVTDLNSTQARTVLNVADGATANSSDATLLARANHTGTQTASTVSDFTAAADARVAAAAGVTVQAYDADLATIAALTPTTDNFLLANASAWASRTPAQAKTALALVKADVGLANVADVDQQNAANLTTGTVAPARLGSGSGGATKFLREDSTYQAIAGGGDALVANPLSQFAATTSLQLKGVLSDETGSGAAVFATSPALVTPTGIVKADVGLANVDNTSDTAKPVSTATQTALNLKADLTGVDTLIMKAADESRLSTTTTTADATLLFSGAINSEYLIEGTMYVDGAAAADMKVGIYAAAGATGYVFVEAPGTAVAAASYTLAGSTVAVGVDGAAFGTVAVGTIIAIPFRAYVKTAGTAGNIELRWAQGTSTASNTTMRRGSYLQYRKAA